MLLQMHLVISIFTPFCLCQSLLYFSALTHQPHAKVNHCRSTAAELQSWVLPKMDIYSRNTALCLAGENWKENWWTAEHHLQWWWIALPGGRVRPKHRDGTHAWCLLSFSGTHFYFILRTHCPYAPSGATPSQTLLAEVGQGGTPHQPQYWLRAI